MFNPTQIKICTVCQEAKPYPGDFITSYKKMELSSQCKDCRNAKKRIQAKARLGKSEKESGWKNSMSKFYKF